MMRKFNLIVVSIAIASCISCSSQEEQKDTKTVEKKTVELSNKQKAVALLESLESGDQTPVSYINSNKYIQHNLAVGDGLEGFGVVMQNAPEGGFKAKVVRAFQDGDFVFTHTIYDFFGPKIGFDIFRFENGLIVEHWDNLIPVAPANPSGRSQTDGPTNSSDLDKTAVNKVLVKNFVSSILVQGQYDQLGDYIEGENYLQHNPFIADGLSGLSSAIEEMAKNNIQMIYTKNHMVLGEGNFVLTVSEGTFANKPTSYYDLFRVEAGKIVEHWDVVETILPSDQWKNTNGKF